MRGESLRSHLAGHRERRHAALDAGADSRRRRALGRSSSVRSRASAARAARRLVAPRPRVRARGLIVPRSASSICAHVLSSKAAPPTGLSEVERGRSWPAMAASPLRAVATGPRRRVPGRRARRAERAAGPDDRSARTAPSRRTRSVCLRAERPQRPRRTPGVAAHAPLPGPGRYAGRAKCNARPHGARL
jgi:hypothetical protein